MLLGFISLLLTVGQATISEICVSKAIGNSWRPCGKKKEKSHYIGDEDDHHEEAGQHRRLLSLLESGATQRRVLAAVAADKCAAKA